MRAGLAPLESSKNLETWDLLVIPAKAGMTSQNISPPS